VKQLNFDTDPHQYFFNLLAQDQAGQSKGHVTKKTITVHLLDLPSFGRRKNETLVYTVSENEPVGWILAKIDANLSGDFSSMLNNDFPVEFEYSIVSGNTFGIFDIEKSTGTLYLAKQLDFEQLQSHTLTIDRKNLMARDLDIKVSFLSFFLFSLYLVFIVIFRFLKLVQSPPVPFSFSFLSGTKTTTLLVSLTPTIQLSCPCRKMHLLVHLSGLQMPPMRILVPMVAWCTGCESKHQNRNCSHWIRLRVF